MRRTFGVSIVLLGLAASAWAGGAFTDRVVGDAAWVAHVDWQALLASRTGASLLEMAKLNPGLQQGLDEIRRQTGMDLLTDVRGATMFGTDANALHGVAVFDATVEPNRLIDIARKMEGYRQSRFGSLTIHQWTAPEGERHGETIYGCVFDRQTVLLGDDAALMRRALDVLAGKAQSLSASKALSLLPASREGAILIAAANELKFPAKKGKRNPLVEKLSAAGILLGEKDGVLYAEVSVTAKTEADGKQLREIVQGFAALFNLAKEQDENAHLRDLGEEIRVSGEGQSAKLSVTLPAESLMKLIEHEAMKKRIKVEVTVDR